MLSSLATHSWLRFPIYVCSHTRRTCTGQSYSRIGCLAIAMSSLVGRWHATELPQKGCGPKPYGASTERQSGPVLTGKRERMGNVPALQWAVIHLEVEELGRGPLCVLLQV